MYKTRTKLKSWRNKYRSKETRRLLSDEDFANRFGRLQKERHALNALLKQPPIPPVKSAEPDPSKSQRHLQPSSPDHIDTFLLDPSQQSILASLKPSPAATRSKPEDTSPPSTSRPPTTPSTVSSRLSRITTGLAPTLDAFASGVHDIELYRSTADAVSSRILRICAQRLEERDALNTQQRLLIEGDDSDQRPPSAGGHQAREDLGVILGALSRVERR